MWIKVQNEDILIEPKLIYINKGLRGTSKCAILAKVTANQGEDEIMTLGVYKNIEETKFIFNDIYSYLSSNKSLYEMP